jgi:hypothetical protein
MVREPVEFRDSGVVLKNLEPETLRTNKTILLPFYKNFF